MCGRCEGEPYRGVRALFDGDLQHDMDYRDRIDWRVISPEVVVYLGTSALAPEFHPLLRGCDDAAVALSDQEFDELIELSEALSRPIC